MTQTGNGSGVPSIQASHGTFTAETRARRYSADLTHLLEERGGLYAIISYSRAYTSARIRHLYKGSLAQTRPALLGGEPTLLVFPEGSRIEPFLLRERAGVECRLLSDEEPRSGDGSPLKVVIEQSLSDARGIAFYAEDDRSVTTMEYVDFEKVARPRVLKFAVQEGPERYRSKIKRVAPESARPHLKAKKRCFLGVSLENESFDRDELLESTVGWVSRQFDECQVLVGDFIHRLSLQIKHPGLSEDDARAQALALGRRFVEDKRRVFDLHARRCRFTYLPMSAVADRASYHDQYQRITQFAAGNERYRQSLRRFAETFVSRVAPDRGPAEELDVERSVTYLLEEGAVFASLVEDGWPVMVYPGSIDPFIEISEGAFPDAPDALKALICVAMKFRRLRGYQETTSIRHIGQDRVRDAADDEDEDPEE